MASICPKCGKFMEGGVCEKCHDTEESERFFAKQAKKDAIRRKIKLGVIIVIVVAVVSIGLYAGFRREYVVDFLKEYGIMEKTDIEILTELIRNEEGYEDGIHLYDIEIVRSEVMRNFEYKVGEGVYNRLVLYSYYYQGSLGYELCAVNFDEGLFAIFDYGDYEWLRIVCDSCIPKLSIGDQRTNFDIVLEFVNRYGFDFTKHDVCSREYLTKLVSSDGIISVKRAQQAIADNADSLFGGECEVFFEGNEVAPKYYMTKTTKMMYNWTIFPESVYSTWKNTVDAETRDLTYSIYGSPYVEKTVWVLYNSSKQELAKSTSKSKLIEYKDSLR